MLVPAPGAGVDVSMIKNGNTHHVPRSKFHVASSITKCLRQEYRRELNAQKLSHRTLPLALFQSLRAKGRQNLSYLTFSKISKKRPSPNM